MSKTERSPATAPNGTAIPCARRAHFSLILACALLLIFSAAALPASAQTFTTLARFNGTNGENPYSAPVQGPNGDFYGATGYGGANDQGVAYEMTPQGSLTLLHTFSESEAAQPFANLLLTSSGSFYSTSFEGGTSPFGSGTVFEMTPSGTVSVLYNFCTSTCADGANPNDALLLATDGNFYGTTLSNGTNGDWGSIFRMTPSGSLTTLYSFCSQPSCTDGSFPYGSLVQGANGNFYGTTGDGGAQNDGSIFKITPSGTLTTLYSFCSLSGCTDGKIPYSGLVLASNGSFYGTTNFGGANGKGSIFKITPAGVFTSLYSFCSQPSCTDGSSPYAALIQATDGNLYGTTYRGGATNAGTIFKISPSGAFSVMYNFCSQTNCRDGNLPIAGLVQSTNGSLYGATTGGGSGNLGTIYRLSAGLHPFAQTVPPFGKAGAQIIILGNKLSSTTAVNFNGQPAAFTVVSDTEVMAAVPTGASTGAVTVSTSNGILKSNTKFQVLP